nr:hypothetical protein [Chlamydiota bacterium]
MSLQAIGEAVDSRSHQKEILFNGKRYRGRRYRKVLARTKRLQRLVRTRVPTFNLARACIDKQDNGTPRVMTTNRWGAQEYRLSKSREGLYRHLDRDTSIDVWEIKDELGGVTTFRCDDWGENANFGKREAFSNLSSETEFGIFAVHDVDIDKTTYFQESWGKITELSGREALKLVRQKRAAKEKSVKVFAVASTILSSLQSLLGWGVVAGSTFEATASASSSALSTLSSLSSTLAYGGLTLAAGLSGASRMHGNRAPSFSRMGAVLLSLPLRVRSAAPLCPIWKKFHSTDRVYHRVRFFNDFVYAAVNIDGVRLIDVGNPLAPRTAGKAIIPGCGCLVRDLVLDPSGNYTFAIDYYNLLAVVNTIDKENPWIEGSATTPARLQSVAYNHNTDRVYLTGTGLTAVRVSTKNAPAIEGTPSLAGHSTRGIIFFGGRNLAVGDATAGTVEFFDVINPANKVNVGTYNSTGSAEDFVYDEARRVLYIAFSGSRVEEVDVNDLGNPRLLSTHGPLDARAMTDNGDKLLVVGPGGLSVLKKIPANLSYDSGINPLGIEEGVAVDPAGQFAYMGSRDRQLQVVELPCPTTTTTSTTSTSMTSTTSSTTSVSSVTTTISSQSSTSAPKTQTRSPTRVSR